METCRSRPAARRCSRATRTELSLTGKRHTNAGESIRKQLEGFLPSVVPAATFIETFEPDLAALGRLDKCYADLGDADELRVVRTRYAVALEGHARMIEGTAAAGAWQKAANLYRLLDEPDRRLQCLQRAVACEPDRYEARRLLGKCLLDMGNYPEAEEHLRRCLQWRPQDKTLRREVEAAMDGRLRMSNRRRDVLR